MSCWTNIKEITYLGHKLNSDGLKADPDKVKAVLEMKSPEDKPALRRFLGIITYLGKFISNLSTLTATLRTLLEKDIHFHWNKEHEQCFQNLKNIITQVPVLRYFDVEKPVTLSVDSSSQGVGDVLLQETQPVAFASKALTTSQKNYAQIEKEMYAIVFACRRFHDYIYGRDVVHIETDHKPLELIYSKPLYRAPPRLQKMMLELQKYTLHVKYKPGKELHIADALSRAYIDSDSSDDDTFDVCMLQQMPISDDKWTQIQENTRQDITLQDLLAVTLNGWPEHRWQLPEGAKPYWNYRDEISVYDGVLFKSDRVIVPTNMRKDMLNLIHDSHLGIEKCKRRARDVVFWPSMNEHIEDVAKCGTCNEHRMKNQKEPLMPIATMVQDRR